MTKFIQVKKEDSALTEELLVQLLKSSQLVFLTGGAGSGKTYLLKRVVKLFRDVAILAPTGIAAFNVAGQTIHSFFRFPPHLQKPSEVSTSIKNSYLIKKLELLVIDEVSMVNALMLDCIDSLMRRIRDCALPFGGCAVLFCGDMAQLAPVVHDKKTGTGLSQKEALSKLGYSSSFISCSKVWDKLGYIVELQGSWRQDTDNYFFSLLSDMRNFLLKQGVSSIKKTVSDINEHTQNNILLNYTTLAPTNQQVGDTNVLELGKLKGRERSYTASITGEWRDELSRAPRELILKEGAQVLCVANDPHKKFFNGDLGRVLELEKLGVWLELESGRSVKVSQSRWDNWQYDWDEERSHVCVRSVGTFSQLPIQLGYAMTIHSSQGLTLGRVKFVTERLFDFRLAYVAISRCPDLASLSLSRPLCV